jgi:hypothetical protein
MDYCKSSHKNMSELKSTPLTRDELFRGYMSGTHVVQEPIIGYKKIACRFRPTIISALRISNNTDEVEHCIAKVEIPIGATIIRPYNQNLYSNYMTTSDKLRTNRYKMLEINQMPGDYFKKKIYDAWSIHRPAFKYETNAMYEETLDPSESVVCTNGLHFFLNNRSAEYYVI